MLDKAVKSIVTAETLPWPIYAHLSFWQWTKTKAEKDRRRRSRGSKKNKNKNSINSPKIHFTFSHNL